MAKYFEKQKDQNLSEDHYLNANQCVIQWQRFLPLNRQKRLLKTIQLFKSINQNFDIPKNKGEGIIFILGMPRSGTTLTESILGTNSELFAGGELLFFEHQLKNKIFENEDVNNFQIDEEFLIELGDKYIQQINFLKKDRKFFSDKLPDNYSYLGFMKLALPSAKFIYISRNPWDNAISIFKQQYLSNLLYSSSFFNIGLEYSNHLAIVDFWKSYFGENIFLSITYEELVKNPNLIAQQIWSYCGFSGNADFEQRSSFMQEPRAKLKSEAVFTVTLLKNRNF